MGISRDSRHKRRETGGRRNVHIKKRKYEMGRPTSNTRIGAKKYSVVRARGGNLKYRALRLDAGNFSWGSEVTTRKTRVLDVVYNSSNNELVRTKTLVKGAIIQIDATPFRQWYEQYYGTLLGKKLTKAQLEEQSQNQNKDEKHAPTVILTSKSGKERYEKRTKGHELDANLKEQFQTGKLLASIASRPGQSGRCDGYILEGKELEFYMRKLQKKK